MKDLFSKEKLPFFFIGIYLLAEFVWYMLTDSPWDDDCVTRFYKTKQAIADPSSFLSRWTRPLFVILYFIPFQISKHFILLMPIYTAISVYFLYRACLKIKLPNTWLVVPFVLFQAYFYGTTRSSLAEPLAAIIICFGFYFLVEKKWLWFALIGGLLPLARLELSLLLIPWGLLMLKEKQWKYLLLLGLPTLLWNFGGTLLNGDPLWLYTETFGTDSGENRYGNTTFQHYFLRYIFVTGPVIFYFMLIGFFQDLFKRKINMFIHVQFLIGFFVYVLFSWKLSLGQAAGFLRHLIVLAPLVAVLALNGFNYTLTAIFGSKLERETGKIFSQDRTDLDEEKTLLKQIKELEAKRDSGELKKRQARHLINELKGKLVYLDEKAKNNKLNIKIKEKSIFSNKTFIALLSITVSIITYVYLSSKIEYHHNLLTDNDYTNFYIVGGFSLIVIVLMFIPKFGKMKSLKGSYIGLVLIILMSFTLITEPPSAHESHERRAMSKLARLYSNSYLTKYPAYNNHNWVPWVSGMDQSEFQLNTIENLENAPDSSIIIWESHYSHRLSGDVPAEYFNDKPEYVELINIRSKKLTFLVIIYQKLMNGGDLSSLAVNDRLIDFYPDQADIISTKARRLLKFGKKKEAEELFKEAMKISPDDFMITSRYANILYEQKKFKESLAMYKVNIEQRPTDYTGYYNVALNYVNLNNFDSAVVNFTNAMEFNEKFSNIYLERGRCYYEKKMFQEALNDYNTYINLEPKKGIGYFNRGVIKSKLNLDACSDFYKSNQLKYPQAANIMGGQCKDYDPKQPSSSFDPNTRE